MVMPPRPARIRRRPAGGRRRPRRRPSVRRRGRGNGRPGLRWRRRWRRCRAGRAPRRGCWRRLGCRRDGGSVPGRGAARARRAGTRSGGRRPGRRRGGMPHRARDEPAVRRLRARTSWRRLVQREESSRAADDDQPGRPWRRVPNARGEPGIRPAADRWFGRRRRLACAARWPRWHPAPSLDRQMLSNCRRQSRMGLKTLLITDVRRVTRNMNH